LRQGSSRLVRPLRQHLNQRPVWGFRAEGGGEQAGVWHPVCMRGQSCAVLPHVAFRHKDLGTVRVLFSRVTVELSYSRVILLRRQLQQDATKCQGAPTADINIRMIRYLDPVLQGTPARYHRSAMPKDACRYGSTSDTQTDRQTDRQTAHQWRQGH